MIMVSSSLTQARSAPLIALLIAHLLRRGRITCQKLISKRAVITRDNGCAQLVGQAQHETNIMDAAQAIIQVFLRPQQVMHVGRAIITTGVAIAALFNRAMLASETRRFDIDATSSGEESAVPRYAGG